MAEESAHDFDVSSSSEDLSSSSEEDDEASGDGAVLFAVPVSESSSQPGRRWADGTVADAADDAAAVGFGLGLLRSKECWSSQRWTGGAFENA